MGLARNTCQALFYFYPNKRSLYGCHIGNRFSDESYKCHLLVYISSRVHQGSQASASTRCKESISTSRTILCLYLWLCVSLTQAMETWRGCPRDYKSYRFEMGGLSGSILGLTISNVISVYLLFVDKQKTQLIERRIG